MKKLLISLALVLVCASPTDAAWAFVASVAGGSPDTLTFTTGSMNSTGADTIKCYVAEQESVGDTTLSDSYGNTWQTDITERKDVATANLLGRLRYCKGCTVGAGHTFTVTDTSGAGNAAVACAAFSGGHLTSPLDQQNGTVDIDAGLSNTTGSITPSEDNTLVVTGLGFSGNAATIAINTGEAGYTITDQVNYTSNHKGVALAYKIQGAAAATNPTWSYSTNEYAVTSIASFKVAVAVTARRGTLLGVGP